MWTRQQLADDLRELGLPQGANVLIHVSLRSIGPIENGAETLAYALLDAIGPQGTLLVPTFTQDAADPADWLERPSEPEELARLRAAVPLFDPDRTPATVRAVGVFPDVVRRLAHARRSMHPRLSFAALGAEAEFLTQNVPFHYPLGSDSPLARLHQINGYILLIGVGHSANSSLHLAEVWADVPYIHRSTQVKTGAAEWTAMAGSPECREGFRKIEPVLRQARILKRGYIGNAESQLMRQRELVSMAVAMLQGRGDALLCDSPACRWCATASRLTADVSPPI